MTNEELDRAVERLEAAIARYPREPRLRTDKADLRLLFSERAELLAAVERMRGTIERLASSEAFDVPQAIDGPLAQELRMRLDYARAALTTGEEK